MNCARWQRLVALYVGDDLDRSRSARVKQHLSACPSCRDLEQDLRRDLQTLGDLDAAATATLDLGSVRGAVLEKIENRRKRSPMLLQPRLLAALAMVVVVIALALVFRQSRGAGALRTVSRGIPSPAPGQAAVPKPRETSPPQPTPEFARPIPNTANTLLVRAETSPSDSSAPFPPSVPVEPMTIKILTDDPEVVIYWIVDPKGDEKHV
jgi:hypothetical protein